MKSNEELEVLKNAPENEVGNSGSEKTLEEIPHDQDYSNFSKKDFVDLLKDLVKQNDYKKTEAVLKEVRIQFDENLEREKSEALKRFIDNGGATGDFEFRADALEIAFEANFKIIRDRKLEHFRSLEQQKNENFARKNALLDELRALVDGEDGNPGFDKFKDIQRQWKEIGAVPALQVRPQWASYHALIDRFYDNRNIYFELKELDRKKNLEAKLDVCVRAEKLAEVAKINTAIKELNELHEEYKHIGPVSRDEKNAVWERFKKASDAVFERRDAYVAELQDKLSKNLSLKDQILTEITALSTFQSDRIKDWNQKTADIIAVQKNWMSVGAVPRNKTKEVNKQFWSAFKTFFANKGGFFKKLDESRNANLELKRELVNQAETLKNNPDDKTGEALKALQIKWKEIGPVPEKMREKIFLEFKSACDHYFEQKRVKYEQSEKEQTENLAKKEAICQELEKIFTEKNGTLDQLRELQRNFQIIGFVPRQAMSSIKSRFTDGLQKAMASLGQVSQAEKDKAMLEIHLENLKSDPDAAYKVQTREQALRKRIAREENDLATLKNNLEFFGRSKNAEKVKAEFGEKIRTAEDEISILKEQLKTLRAAVRAHV